MWGKAHWNEQGMSFNSNTGRKAAHILGTYSKSSRQVFKMEIQTFSSKPNIRFQFIRWTQVSDRKRHFWSEFQQLYAKAAPTVQVSRLTKDSIWGVSNSWKEFKKTLTSMWENSLGFYLLGTNLICFENQVFFRSSTTSCNTLKRRPRQLEALKKRLSAFFFCQT